MLCLKSEEFVEVLYELQNDEQAENIDSSIELEENPHLLSYVQIIAFSNSFFVVVSDQST